MRVLYLIILIALLTGMILGACKQSSRDSKAGSQDTGSAVSDTFESTSVYTRKLKHWNQQIREHPGRAHLYYKRARIYRMNSRFRLAKGDLEKAIDLDSDNASYYLEYGNVCWEVNYVKGAINSLERATALDPDLEDAYLKLGKIYFYLKKRKKSFHNLNEALRLDKVDGDIYYWKAMNYLEMGDTAMAVSNLQTSLEMKPDHAKSYLKLGLIYSARGEPVAIDYLNNVIRLDSESLEGWYSRGMAWQRFDSFQRAIKDYKAVLDLYPQHRSANYNLGYLYYLQKQYQRSVPYFSRAIKADSAYGEAYLGRGAAYQLLGKKQKAEQDLKRVLELDPDNTVAKELLEAL